MPASSGDQAVFGPVPSRRLGFSLGVDLLWPKTCTLDCVYCELGPTTRRTTRRQRFRPVRQVLDQVERRLSRLPHAPDFITLAGSGEPTLHLDLGLVLEELARLQAARLAVLSNGTLFTDPAVRRELARADVVIPSLDAVSPEAFRRVNQPAPGLEVAEIIEGLVSFRRQYRGELLLEILLVEGLNDQPEEIELLAEAARRIAPDMVQLNTVVRPPARGGVRPVSHRHLARVAAGLGLPCQVIAPPARRNGGEGERAADQVVEMTRRRPCTVEDIAAMTGLEPSRARELVRELVGSGRLRPEPFEDMTFYRGIDQRG
jgi:wyosine [tRNA(Phe)-imidazoG37] synthetase (radical SAM superfamily)